MLTSFISIYRRIIAIQKYWFRPDPPILRYISVNARKVIFSEYNTISQIQYYNRLMQLKMCTFKHLLVKESQEELFISYNFSYKGRSLLIPHSPWVPRRDCLSSIMFARKVMISPLILHFPWWVFIYWLLKLSGLYT